VRTMRILGLIVLLCVGAAPSASARNLPSTSLESRAEAPLTSAVRTRSRVGSEGGQGLRTRPNFVLIVADDAGYNEVGFTGDNGFLTPRLDGLAAEGFRLTSGYVASPVCSPSRVGLLTGLIPQRFGYEHNISNDPDADDGLPADAVILTETLHDLGYATGVVGKWHLGARHGISRPLDRGVDEFYGLIGGSRSYWAGATAESEVIRRQDMDIEERWALEGDPSEYDPVFGRYVTDAFGDEGARFVDAHAGEPFFLYLSFTAPHYPAHAKQQDLDAFPDMQGEQRARAAMTLAMDRAVGKVLDALERNQVEDETVVVFVNDNGGQNPRDNSPYRGYKGELWEGGIRVPFVVRVPGLAAGEFDRPVSTLDLAPTLIGLAGGDPGGLDGVDLVPFLSGQASGDPHERLWYRFGNTWAVREADWKLTRPHWLETVRLHDLAQDPGESQDLIATHPDTVSRLLVEMTRFEASMDKPRWGVLGADDQNGFDHFIYRWENGSRVWATPLGWLRGGSSEPVTLWKADGYANAVLEFPIGAGGSYAADNNRTRISDQTFMLNELRFTGEFGGAAPATARVHGLPLLLVESLSGRTARLALHATGNVEPAFTFEVANDLHTLGDLEITGDGTQALVISGDLTEFVPGRGLTKRGASEITISGDVDLSGALLVEEGTLRLEGIWRGTLTGIDVDRSAVLRLAGGSVGSAHAEIRGTLEGVGTVSSSVVNLGTLSPGDPVGVLAIEGGYAQPTGSLVIHVAGDAPGVIHDRLSVTGAASLAGDIRVRLADGFAPRFGDRFVVAEAHSVTGGFDRVIAPGLGNLEFRARTGVGEVLLVVACRADIDDDDRVTSRDFIIFLNLFAVGDARADHDGDGVVNSRDFIAFLNAFIAGC
jgi:autotransporter-associated beta strand protein